MARLHLTLLGGFQARLDPGATLALPTRKAQALLAYLAVPPGRLHPRNKLAALLWGGIREESARASLRQALFAIRKALGAAEGVVRQDGDALRLDPTAIEVDVAAFEDAVANGSPEALEHAADLYRGDLMSGFTLDEPPFEEWLLSERERLRERALEALAQILAHQRKAGATEPAIQTALRLLALDPLQEVVHRALMRLYAAAGRRGAALRQYQQCVNVLGRELGIEPEPETKTLYRDILRHRPSRVTVIEASSADPHARVAVAPSRAPVADVPMIGRAQELEQLKIALDEACAGHGAIIAILGEAGIGKTRLVSELVTTAEARGTRVLLGRSYETEQVLPFGPWVDAFRAAHATGQLRTLSPIQRADLSHLFPELASADVERLKSAPDFLKVFESVTTAVAVLAGQRPLVLVIEDVHWADEMSLRLLAFLARRLQALPVLAIITFRDEELPDAAMLRRVLSELQRERRLSVLIVKALSYDDTVALVQTLARSGTDTMALARLREAAWNASAGNPFVIVETVHSHVQGTGLSDAVRQLVTHRLERLSERAGMLTAVAALIGREFEFALVQRAAGLSENEAAESVEELIRHRVLHGVGERFDFTHDRIRDVVRAEILAPRRRALHRRVAEAIESVYAEDLQQHVLALGLHYEGAEMWPQAVGYLRRAATHAFTQSAYRAAVSCLERALAAASRLPQTAEVLNEMLDLWLQLRTALWPLAEFDRIGKCLEDAERLAIALDDRRRQGNIAAYVSVLRWITGDVPSARHYAQTAHQVAASVDDSALRAISNFYLGLAHYVLGVYAESEAAFLENVPTLAVTKERYVLGAPRSHLVLAAAWVVLPFTERGAFEAGLAYGQASLKLAEDAEDFFGIVTASYCLAYLHGQKGELDLAAPLLERALAVCRAREFSVWLPQITGYLGHVHAQAGRVDEGLAMLERAIEIYEATRAWPFRTLFTAHRGGACLLAGRRDDALALGRAALTLARDHHERGHEAWALRFLGEVASQDDARDGEIAEGHYREALALATELGMRPLVAHCHLGLGLLCRQVGVRATTRQHLNTAAAMFRDLDMGTWRARAEAMLRVSGD